MFYYLAVYLEKVPYEQLTLEMSFLNIFMVVHRLQITISKNSFIFIPVLYDFVVKALLLRATKTYRFLKVSAYFLQK